MFKAIITFFISATLLAGNAFAVGVCHNPKGDSKPGERESVVYNADRPTSKNSRDLNLKIVRPESSQKGKLPLVIGIHGGGFIDKCFVQPCHERYLDKVLIPEFLSHGFAVAAVQYRLSSPLEFLPSRLKAEKVREMHYKAAQDARQAIKYIFENADKLDVDKENVFLIGVSAGAITALHSVYATQDTADAELVKEFGPLEPVQDIRAVISVSGALYDISTLKNGPKVPLMLVHGRKDFIVPADKGYYLALDMLGQVYGGKAIFDEALKLGLPATGHFYDVGHAFPDEIKEKIFDESRTFLVKNLKCQAKAPSEVADTKAP